MARILLNTNPIPSKTALADPPIPSTTESDFVVILAALLCALICTVGLIAVARCACLRRGTAGSRGIGRYGSQLAANRGLKKKVVQSLPKYVFGSSSSSASSDEAAAAGKAVVESSTSDCVICLTEYVDGDEIRVLPQCGHRFHVQCIDTWLNSRSSCPSCRQILVVARCQKCGEFPTVSGVRPQLPPPIAVPFKGRTGYGLPSTSATFLP